MSIEITLSQDIDFFCSECGNETDLISKKFGGFKVVPCDKCMEEKTSEIDRLKEQIEELTKRLEDEN